MSDQTPSTALAPAAQDAVQNIRQQGAVAVALRQEEQRYFKQIAGLEWGSGNQVVRGSSLSEATRLAFAQFCIAARANPMYHVDLLGGKPYLNARYWSDRLNSDPRYVDHTLINISDDQKMRADYSVPEWATVAYLCQIRTLMPFAPIEKIRTGEIVDFERYVRTVEEANWAGGRPRKDKSGGGSYDADPIGNAEPAKTARTRALRRCAAVAFPVWMQAEDERIKKLEGEIQAEWKVIRGDQKAAQAALPPQEGPQMLRVGAGEPQAAPGPQRRTSGDWRPLDGVGFEEPQAAPIGAMEPGELMGVVGRPAPMVEVSSGYAVPVEVGTLEPSYGDHATAEGQREAVGERMDKVREKRRFLDACKEHGVEDIGGLEWDTLGREPESADDYRELLAALEALHAGGE